MDNILEQNIIIATRLAQQECVNAVTPVIDAFNSAKDIRHQAQNDSDRASELRAQIATLDMEAKALYKAAMAGFVNAKAMEAYAKEMYKKLPSPWRKKVTNNT